MNYLNEEDYIKAINDNPENRAYQLLFAEYLQEKGEDWLAEGWRVLVRDGKKPTFRSWEGCFNGWNWFAFWADKPHYSRLIDSYCLLPIEWFPEEGEDKLIDGHSTFFGAMQAAAVAYVRYTYDENYGKPVIHFVAYKGGDKGTETNMDCHMDWEEREGPNGSIVRRPTLQSNHVSYTNLGYDPEEQIMIIQAITDGEPIMVEIELEDGEAVGKTKARLRHFETLPNNLCNVELTTEETKPKPARCSVCNGTGRIEINFDISLNEVHIPMTYPVYPQAIDCPNCNGKGVTG